LRSAKSAGLDRVHLHMKARTQYAKLFGQPSSIGDLLALHSYEEVLRFCPNMLQVTAAAYFTRVWVAQEMLFGKSVACQLENFAFPVAVLVASFELWHHHDSYEEGNPRRQEVDDICSRYLQPSLTQTGLSNNTRAGPGTRDLAIVDQFSDRQCSDPRDHIYGLSALFDAPSDYIIDYSLSVAGVFSSFTVHCFRASNDCSAFSSYRSSTDGFDNRFALPSWCPSWTTGYSRLARELAAKPEARWRASGERRIVLERPSAFVITLRGYLISRVMWRSTNAILDQHSVSTVITEAVEYLLDHPEHTPSSIGPRILAFFRLTASVLGTLTLKTAPNLEGTNLSHSVRTLIANSKPEDSIQKFLGPVFIAGALPDLSPLARCTIDTRIPPDGYESCGKCDETPNRRGKRALPLVRD
jgi:hypothetical protein